MLNRTLLKNKYKDLISEDTPKFLKELTVIKENINFSELSDKPILLYSQNMRNALYYLLGYFYSLRQDRILSYAAITGQTLINQHFLSEDKRDSIYTDIFYTDIAFISLSQFDYTSEYLEAQIIDLIEFRRQNRNKITIVSYDVLNSTDKNAYKTFTRNLNAYFYANNFQIINMVEKSNTNNSGQTTPFDINKPTTTKKARQDTQRGIE